MSADEIKQTISGKSATWESGDHSVKGTIKWAADGTQKMTSNIAGIPKDSGKWRVKGAKLCSKWTKVRDAAEKCDVFESLGGHKYKHGNSYVTLN